MTQHTVSDNASISLGLSIPMFNEEGAAEQVLQQTMYILRNANISFRIAAVNNGSTDSTGAILDTLAQQFPEIIPIHFASNQGYGGGILAGMRTLSAQDIDYLGWMWGDGQVSSDVLPKLIDCMHNGADIAKTHRIQRQDGLLRKQISATYAWLMRVTQNEINDVNGCPKIFTASAWEKLHLESRDWFLDAEAMLNAQRLNLSIESLPVVMKPRLHNKSKVNVRTLIEFTVNIAKWKFHNLR